MPGISARPAGSPRRSWIADEVRALESRGPIRTIPNGCDFDDFTGLEYRPAERFRITHAGSFFGTRDPRPFLQAVSDAGRDLTARFLGDFRTADREWADELGLDDRLELIPYAPRSASLALQRDSEAEALLLLIPEAGGRGRGCSRGRSSSTWRRGGRAGVRPACLYNRARCTPAQ